MLAQAADELAFAPIVGPIPQVNMSVNWRARAARSASLARPVQRVLGRLLFLGP